MGSRGRHSKNKKKNPREEREKCTQGRNLTHEAHAASLSHSQQIRPSSTKLNVKRLTAVWPNSLVKTAKLLKLSSQNVW